MKNNCWDVKKCGRQPGGLKSQELGVCPASSELKLDKIHDGKNGGRCCWAISGTLCGGAVQGTFATKLGSCMKCNFYQDVMKEEVGTFMPYKEIAKRLQP